MIWCAPVGHRGCLTEKIPDDYNGIKIYECGYKYTNSKKCGHWVKLEVGGYEMEYKDDLTEEELELETLEVENDIANEEEEL